MAPTSNAVPAKVHCRWAWSHFSSKLRLAVPGTTIEFYDARGALEPQTAVVGRDPMPKSGNAMVVSYVPPASADPSYGDRIFRFQEERGHVPHNRDLLFVERLRGIGLADDQLALVLDAVETTCHHCWDADTSCPCWNDE